NTLPSTCARALSSPSRRSRTSFHVSTTTPAHPHRPGRRRFSKRRLSMGRRVEDTEMGRGESAMMVKERRR
ncbi:unnamed protein product, partial [Tetraodon nigroviridis]